MNSYGKSVFAGIAATVCLCGAPARARAQDLDTPRTLSSGSAMPRWLQTTVGDFRNLASKDSIAWLAIGGLAANASGTVDHRVTASFAGQPQLESVFHSGATIGDARVQIAAAATTLAIGKISGESKLSMLGGDLLRAQVVAQGVSGALKFAAQRTRPDGTSFSFPSGHTATSFATATVLQRDFGWKFGIPAYAAATYVAASRVENKRHFLSDVAFGASIGIVAGRTVTIGRGEKRFAMSPALTDGGAALNFSWVGAASK